MAEKKTEDAGQAEVQAKFDEADSKGYFGELPKDGDSEQDFDKYTLKGVTSDKK